MSPIQELRARAEGFLKRPPNDLPVNAPAGSLEALGPAPLQRDFIIFLPSHLKHALDLASRFMELANDNPGEQGLQAVIDEAEKSAEREDIELVKYALMVFITHHPEGQRLPIPPLGERSPEKVLPSNRAVLLGFEALGGLGVEAQLDYFREDTSVNDHHLRWHIVYPTDGHPDPNDPTGPNITKKRQGELFWYMHQQMLARYDTERKAFNLSPAEQLKNYTLPLSEGYKANLQGYSNRLPNVVMRDLPYGPGVTYRVSDHDERRKRLLAAAESGQLQNGTGTVPVTIDLLASTAESNLGSVEGASWDDVFSFYGSHHNIGHGLLASLPDPNGPFPNRGGVMRNPATAVRDPIFFRWHRHVDETFYIWQQLQESHNLTADAPKVSIRKNLDGATDGQSPDILVCMQKEIAGAHATDFDGQKFADENFGGDGNWDKPLSSFGFGINELHTMMRQETINLPSGGTGLKPYLDHEEFYYFLRLENLLDQPQKVTVRLFLVAGEFAEERRMWIEMDKFAHSLDSKQKAVVFRPARFSSVVRKPARRPTDPPVPPHTGNDPDYCDCGWPYHLLLPRGTEAGMDFRLVVILTDYQADLVGAEQKCGSMSFCGVKNADYPDKKPMGYPFDRPFAAKISEVFASSELVNIATKDFKIKHVKVMP